MAGRAGLHVVLAIAVLRLGVGATPAWAQITGTLAGTVRDQTGALLPGATVSVRGPALQRHDMSTVTGERGTYRIPLVPPGTYEVAAELAGFTPQVQRQVEVAINQQTTLDFTLGVATVTEQVDVQSQIPLVEVNRSDVTSRISTATIDALPLNGRNFTDLIGLVPGALPLPAGQQGADVSIFGERGSALSFLVDGAENNDPLNGGAFLRFTQDAIQEFEVVTTGYEAEFGRAQGGVANIITRSGTNAFEGRAFAFFRNDRLDSSNVPGQDVPELDREQWGGTVGGPIVHDRAFFFGSFEVLDEQRGVNIDRSQIPDFVASGLATPGGVEDFGLAPETDGFTGLFKLDVNLSPNNRLSASGNRSTQDVGGEISSPIAGTIALPSAARTETQGAASGTIRETMVIRPTLFLESTATVIKGRRGSNLEREARIEPILVLLQSGFLQTGAPFGGRNDRTTTRFQIAQSLSHYVSAKGEHQVKIGWDWNRVGVEGFNEITNDVEYSAAFLSPAAHAINEELFRRLGFEQSAARFFTLSGNPDGSLTVDIRDNSTSLFAQDTWQVRDDVTLTSGLRYDYSSLFGGDKNNLAPRLGVAWDVVGRRQTVVKASFGIFFDRNLLAAAATVPEKGGIFTRSAFDVALPRLGAEYTDSLIDLVITSGFPTGTGGRTPAENPAYRGMADALRTNPLALYTLLGITVQDPANPPVVTAANVEALSGRTPEQVVAILESTWPGTDWEFFDVPGGSIVGDAALSFFPRGPLGLSRDVSRYEEDQTPWTRAFNAGIEQELTGGMSLAVSYVHRRTRDLLTRRITNLFDVPPGDPDFGRTTDGGPRISQVTYDGWIDYDGIVVALRRRFSRGYQFGVSYTGSRARDNLLTGDVGTGFSNNNHPEIDEGPSNLSVPHNFVASGVVALPWDVTVSGIVTWRSGAAFSPRGIQDLDGDGLVDQRDTTQPRNSFRTDPFANVDLRVEKQVRLAGRHTISLIAEAFNLANRANVRNVNAVAGPDFGEPVTYFPGREIQFGVRYLFGQR